MPETRKVADLQGKLLCKPQQFTMLHLDVIRHTKCISSEIARPTSLDILDAIEVTGREKENP
jgi:hypothetical protein